MGAHGGQVLESAAKANIDVKPEQVEEVQRGCAPTEIDPDSQPSDVNDDL